MAGIYSYNGYVSEGDGHDKDETGVEEGTPTVEVEYILRATGADQGVLLVAFARVLQVSNAA